MRKVIRFIKYLVFTSIPALGLLIGIEAWLRHVPIGLDFQAFEQMPLGLPGDCYRPSLRVGYEPTPGRCSHDAAGFALAHHSSRKAPGTYRILVLGDSITEQRMWVDKLEASLNQALPSRRFELWNAAVTGYDTCSELGVLAEKGIKIEPDMVLVQICVNDFVLTATVFPLGGHRLRYFAGNSYIDFPDWVLLSRLATWMVVRFSAHQVADRSQNLDGVTQSDKCFQVMKKTADARHIPLVSAIFPGLVSSSQLQSQPEVESPVEIEKKFASIQDRLGIDHIDLRGPLEKLAPLEALRSHPNDAIHPNPWGHDLAAYYIGQHLLGRYFGWKGEPGPVPHGPSIRPLAPPPPVP